jgi:hypothetical protein
LKKALVR